MRCHGITVIGRRCKIKCGHIFCHIHYDQVKKEKDCCSICLDTLKAPLKLKCAHSFCKECIHTWICNNPNCPYCRKPVNEEEMLVAYNYGVENKLLVLATQIKILISDCTEEEINILYEELYIFKGRFINEQCYKELQNKKFFSIIKKLPQIKNLVYFKCSNLEIYERTLKNNIYYLFE